MSFFLAGGRRIFAAEHDSLISPMGILKAASHFHLDFMDERLAFTDLLLDLTRCAQERTEFTRSPTRKRRFVFALETMPAGARVFQARHRIGASSRRRASQRLLINDDNCREQTRTSPGSGISIPSCAPFR